MEEPGDPTHTGAQGPSINDLDVWWNGLRAGIEKLGEGWIFRGLSDAEFRLENTLQRLTREIRGDLDPSAINDFEQRAVGFFKTHVSALPLVERLPDDSEVVAWLSLMRHYGAPCRLLDWTQSYPIALYFAARENAEKDGMLWCFDAGRAYYQRFGFRQLGPRDHLGIVREDTTTRDGTVGVDYPGPRAHAQSMGRLIQYTYSNQVDWPLSLLPDKWNSRLASQQGVFTLVGKPDRILDEYLDRPDVASSMPPLVAVGLDKQGTPIYPHPGDFLRKFQVPQPLKPEILKRLSLHNIDAFSLFPGLDGLGRATSEALMTGKSSCIEWFM